MTISNISTSYLYGALLPSITQAQNQLATLQVESATGEYANLGLQLGGQSGYELSLRSQDDLLQSLTTANGITATSLSTAQNAYSSILTAAQSTAQSLAQATSNSNEAGILQTLGQNSLQTLTSLTNVTSANGYVFGGQNTQTAPLDDFFAQPSSSAKTAIANAFQSYFGFSTTSPQAANISQAQMQGFLSGPFASLFQSPAWGSTWSTATDANATAQIAPGSFVDATANANTAGFQQLAQGYAMLTEFANIGLGSGAQQAVVSAATTAVTTGISSINNTEALLGESQNQITQANSQMSNQMTLLQTEIGRLDNVDPAQVATELSALSTQLATSYQLTSQIHNMNLAQYLPT